MDDDAVRLLASIDRRLALLTGPQEREMRRTIISQLLRTEARIKMFDGIDGQRGSPDLARIAGVSDRTCQLFIKELLDAGLVRQVESGAGGRAVFVSRDEDAIIQWYLEQQSD